MQNHPASSYDITTYMKGRYDMGVPLEKYTWFQVGGPADFLFFPQDEEALSHFLKHSSHVPKTVLGAGSNMLVRDGGIGGVVIKLGKGFHQFHVNGRQIEVGAGLLGRFVAERCQQLGLSGFEFLFTIPGTIGGVLRSNAGCYGTETCDHLVYAWALDTHGTKHQISAKDLNYRYRGCDLPKDWIFVGACFEGVESDPQSIEKTMQSFLDMREKTQPLHVRTGGSTFCNTPRGKAWELIRQAGCANWTQGDACFSEKHCNFLVNKGNATALDLETLGESVRHEVLLKTGVLLDWEIVRLGFLKQK